MLSAASARSCSVWRCSCSRARRGGAGRRAPGGAVVPPPPPALILPEFEPSERHSAIGVWAATGGIAAAAGPPLGGLLVQADWRLVFLVHVPGGLIGLLLRTRHR